MKRSGSVLLVSVGLALGVARGADATSPLDLTERNAPFAPGSSVQQPDKRAPEINQTTQQKRVTPPTVDKKPAAVGERRAPIEVTETREKNIQEKQTRTPEKVEQPKSRFDQQRARITTSDNTTKPPTVAKYQDSLSAASASNMARFPAVGSATSAKVNRFVFRKNGGELVDAPGRAPIVPAAGGATLGK